MNKEQRNLIDYLDRAINADMVDAGYSTCPICTRYWKVVIFDDCLLPACGCYGNDTSANNPNRPCQSCGIKHALACLEIGEELGDKP